MLLDIIFSKSFCCSLNISLNIYLIFSTVNAKIWPRLTIFKTWFLLKTCSYLFIKEFVACNLYLSHVNFDLRSGVSGKFRGQVTTFRDGHKKVQNVFLKRLCWHKSEWSDRYKLLFSTMSIFYHKKTDLYFFLTLSWERSLSHRDQQINGLVSIL